MSVIMKCGCASNADWQNGKGEVIPYCIIHNCVEPLDFNVVLSGRMCKCSYCGQTVPSKMSLPFFKYNVNKKIDSYYCGCWGFE